MGGHLLQRRIRDAEGEKLLLSGPVRDAGLRERLPGVQVLLLARDLLCPELLLAVVHRARQGEALAGREIFCRGVRQLAALDDGE